VVKLRTVSSLKGVPAAAWNALTGGNPALSHAYLLALEETRCASPETGWAPQFLLANDDADLVGAMPLYFKSHSYGEFVFDWAWAEAYERSGIPYYPKLVSSIPFTPVSGPRMMARDPAVRAALLTGALEIAKTGGASSFHCLFPPEEEARDLEGLGLMLRRGVQFHWRNGGYQNFEDFLATLRHDKRKKIRQERRKLSEMGVSWKRTRGNDEEWDFFYECYLNTLRTYHSPVPLTPDFFAHLRASMPDNLLLVIGSRSGTRIAAAFDLVTANALYGRSWGALEYLPGMHFEACYYQAIDHCIEQGIGLFEGGAQGEHKLARGFLPETTWSAHWLAHPEFARAVGDFLEQETAGITQAMLELGESSPFKKV
jgi:predicted N-acyltransferase